MVCSRRESVAPAVEQQEDGEAHDDQEQEQENAREDEHEIARLLPDGSTRTQSSIGENNKSGIYPGCDGEAVRIKFIRILDTDTTKEYLGQNAT